jgi:hypothetical protein
MSWEVWHVEGRTVVVPVDDLSDHLITGRCWCAPIDDDGIEVHNPMDCREAYERRQRLPT